MRKSDKKMRMFGKILFILYLVVTLYAMFFSESLDRTMVSDEYRYNLVLFKEINRFVSNIGNIRFNIILLNVVGNVVAFIPLGFLLPVITNRKLVWWSTILIAAGASALIEVMQYVTKLGTCDIDDFILNTIGGILGYVFYRILFLIIDVIYRKRQKKS